MAIRILIADDHLLVRRGLRKVLEQDPEIEVVGEGENGLEIISQLENGVQADVLLTDLNMPGMNGLELAEAISTMELKPQIILLTIQEEDHYIQQAFQAGIKSYLFKTAEEDEVIFAISRVARGQPYLCSGLSNRMIQRMGVWAGTQAVSADEVDFSVRELEVLRLIGAGYTNEEAAEKLFTSKRTVEGYRQAMIDKTGSKNSLALITFAMRNGLLS